MLEIIEGLIDNLSNFKHITKQAALKEILAYIHGLLDQEIDKQILASKLMQMLITAEIYDQTVMQYNINICLITCKNNVMRDGLFLLSELWKRSLIKEDWPQNGLILKYYFDEFLCELGAEFVLSKDLCIAIQNLLHSKLKEDRESANFLLRKILDIKNGPLPDSVKLIDKALRDCADHLFSYETIMEWLEHPVKEDYWMFWIRKLSINFVNKTDNDVLFGTLEYILDHVTPIELQKANLLPSFFKATNNLEVHNIEGYFLPEQKLRNFAANIIVNKTIFGCFCGLPWHGVPLIRWLDCLKPENQLEVDEQELFTICVQVRTLKNSYLRRAGQNCIYKLFQINIENMSLNEYLKFVETLFDNSEDISAIAIDKLKSKIDNSPDMCDDIKYLNKSRFHLICGNEFKYDLEDLYTRLVEKFKLMTTNEYGWWRLPAFFSLYKSRKMDFYVSEYKINLKLIEKCKTIKDLKKYLWFQLKCISGEEDYMLKSCVDLFVMSRLTSWLQLKQLHLKPKDILENGTIHSYAHLIYLLSECNKEIETETLLLIVNYWKQNPSDLWAAKGILKYAYENLKIPEREYLTKEMLYASKESYKVVLEILDKAEIVTQSTLQQGMLYGNTTMGDERIESAYCITNWAVKYSTRSLYIRHTERMEKVSIFQIYDALLIENCKILENKMYCIHNSKEHRVILRIVYAMLCLYPKGKGYWSDRFWTSLLSVDNHMNISYFYESLVGLYLTNLTPLLEKIRNFSTLKPTQHDALVSVVHIYCLEKWNSINFEDLKQLFRDLLSQWKHLNRQSMLLTRLVLSRLAKKCQETRGDIPHAAEIKSIMKYSDVDQALEYSIEARLMLPEIISSKSTPPANIICYMTYSPFDEYESPFWLNSKERLSKINRIRYGFKSKEKELSVQFRKILGRVD